MSMASSTRNLRSIEPAVGNQIVETVQAKFEKAFAFHQCGQIGQAEALYKEVLDVQPRHFNGLHLFGVCCMQTERLGLALDLIGKAIEVRPEQAAAYNH